MIQALAALGLLLFSACTAARQATRDQDDEGTKTPSAGNRREVLANDRPLVEAGGFDAFVVGRMRADDRFRFYTFGASYCPACRSHEQTMARLQALFPNIDYTSIDTERMQSYNPPPAIPFTILQYSDCPVIPMIPGALSFDASMRMMVSLQGACAQREKEGGAEESPPAPKPSPEQEPAPEKTQPTEPKPKEEKKPERKSPPPRYREGATALA